MRGRRRRVRGRGAENHSLASLGALAEKLRFHLLQPYRESVALVREEGDVVVWVVAAGVVAVTRCCYSRCSSAGRWALAAGGLRAREEPKIVGTSDFVSVMYGVKAVQGMVKAVQGMATALNLLWLLLLLFFGMRLSDILPRRP